jgi:hypothetical protein
MECNAMQSKGRVFFGGNMEPITEEEIKKSPAWKQAIEDFFKEGFKHGDILERKWLLQHFELVEPKENIEEYKEFNWKYLANIESFKENLLYKHNMDLSSIRGTGNYHIIPPSRQTQKAMQDLFLDLAKTLKKTHSRVFHIEVSELSSSEINENVKALNKLQGLRASVNLVGLDGKLPEISMDVSARE